MATSTRLIYQFDEFQVEPDEHRLRLRGEIVPLHGKAFELLLTLVRSHGRLLTKDEIFEQVWPDQIVEESNLTVNMSAIRRALGERASNPHYITTVSGRGYRFTGNVRQFADEALTIERETFARVTVEQEETETKTALIPSVGQIAHAMRRLATHPVALFVIGSVVLALAGIGIWVRGHRASAAPLPWTNVTFGRFATHGGIPYRVAISPDGKSLVYYQRIEGKNTLWLGQVESNASVQILDQPDTSYDGLTFSPDGQSIYVAEFDASNVSRLVRLPILGGVPLELMQHVDSAVTFSPDGRQLAFLRRSNGETEIIIADADGRSERTLVARKGPENFSSLGLSWSPDGETIAVAAKNAASARVELLSIAVADGSAKRISNRDWGEIGNVKWQADGSGLLFTERSGPLARRSEIWFAPYPQGDPRRITNDVNQYLIQTLSLSAAGAMAVLDGVTESEIWIAPDGDIARARRVLQGVAPKYEGVDGLAWTPDGHLLYTAYVGDAQAIWEMNGDGGNRRQLTSNVLDFVDRQMSVTADNRYIVFQSNRTGSLQIWRANRDGSDLRQLTSSGENTQPNLSPDSKWIVYVSGGEQGSVLMRMSIDGGETAQLTRNASSNPQISPDGKQIAYLESSDSRPDFHLAIMPFSGGQPEQVFALPQRMPVNLAKRMRWSPDGKALMYRDSLKGFWRQRLNEDTPQIIKGSEDVQSSQFAWSFDGKNVAYTRTANMQEILLLKDSR